MARAASPAWRSRKGQPYVPLVRRSHEIWRELEAQTGETLMLQTGGLIIGEGDGAPSHGQAGFLGSTLAIARQHGIPHEMLDSGEVRRRYPQFLVRDAERGYFEPTRRGRLSRTRRGRPTRRLARQCGAVIRANEAVLSIEPCGSGVAVVTDHGRVEAARVVRGRGRVGRRAWPGAD